MMPETPHCSEHEEYKSACGWCVEALRAENARLQARVDNQEPWLVALGRMLVQYRITRFPDDVLAWRDERDRYKALAEAHDCGYALTKALEIAERQLALAERRGEALKSLHAPGGKAHDTPDGTWPSCRFCQAIAAKPDEMDEETAKVYKEGLIAMHNERHPEGD